jgi:hypothetical protein
MTNWLHSAGAEWTAALALSIQALIFALQAAFLGWQARILRRHATTLEKNTEIAGTQAETLKLIGQALNQQGTIMTEQNTIMQDQLKFHERVDERAERSNALTRVIQVQARLQQLDSRLSLIQGQPGMSATPSDHTDVARHFDALAGEVYECQKAMLMTIHFSEKEKKFWLGYCDAMSNLNRTGNMAEDLKYIRAVREKYSDLLFALKLGSLGNISES